MNISLPPISISGRSRALIFSAAFALAACGGSDDAEPVATNAPAAEAETADAADSGLIVTTASSDLGDVLVDVNGLTLYGFTSDVGGVPTCEGGCAQAWPPIIVDSNAVPAGLDTAVFSVAERPDGSFQLVAGDWPLYLFAGDAAPGETNGQGSGDVWFVSAPDGSLIGG